MKLRERPVDAYDREQRRREIARKAERTRNRARLQKRGVVHAKIGTLPAGYLKIVGGGAWNFNPDVGDRFPALYSDRDGNLTYPGEKAQFYRVCDVRRILGERLLYLENC